MAGVGERGVDLSTCVNVMKAVSDPTRVRILKILEGGELCVCQIIAVVALGASTVSRHLSLLRAAGLVQDRRDRKWVRYSLSGRGANPCAAVVLRALRGWLDDDPVIALDRERVERARALGPVAICERGMSLGPRRPARRPSPPPSAARR